MELELTRINYGSVNTTLGNCLKIIPTGEQKKTQKVAVGDLEGNFQMFGIKKSEAQLVFQTYVGQKVSSVQLGGAPGALVDKVFVASENVVKAFTKKGKMFLSFDTNLTEPIKCMFVSGADLIVCGNHVYSHYRDCKDIGTYLCGDTIVDVAALCPNNTNRILTILACSGRVLRILEHCRVRQTVELESVPTVLHVPRKNILGDRILCGFADGKVILYQFGPFTGEVKQKILVDGSLSTSAVTCIDTYDMSNDGHDELIIGRRDGTVQVFTVPSDEDVDLECRQIYRESFSESVSAIQGGCVYCLGWPEIVILLYSGNIFGLTTQIISVSLTNNEIIKKPFSLKNLERLPTLNDLKSLASSSESIKANLVKPAESYQLSAPIQSNAMSHFSVLEVNDSLVLDKAESCYVLFIELPTQIGDIVLESEASIRILNADNETDFSFENLSESDYHFIGKFRMKDQHNRVQIKFQTIEGQYGAIQALIKPRYQPDHAQMRSYIIRPLSLHLRCHSFDSNRPLNVLTLKGPFSHSEMHNWIEQCIPEVPERLSAIETSDLFFENSLIGTVLECKYGRGTAQFRSDNLSTISILKDFLTKEATKKRLKLEMSTDISEPSVPHILYLIERSVTECVKIKKEYTYLQALLQVDIRNETDFNCLMPEYQSILNRRSQIEEDFKKTPEILDKYFGIITDFYIDRFKFKGIFVKEKVPRLMEILENFDMDKLLEFFNACDNRDTNLEAI